MNTQASQQDDLQQGSTPEERFLGVRTEVNLDEPGDGDKVEIETLPGEGEAPADNKSKAKPQDDDELGEYSERVQKRIKRLTWEREEANRKLSAMTDERDEAFRATQSLYGQNQQMQQVIQHGEGHLIGRMKSAAEAAKAAAEGKYRKAYEDGDTDAVIAAQQDMIAAQAELNEAIRAEQDYNFRTQQARQQMHPAMYQHPQAQPQMQQPQRQQQMPQPEPEVREWSDKNPWFNDPKHRDMTAVALSEHERLIRDEHVTPNTPEYYEKIDQKMRTIFPAYFDEAGGDTSAAANVATVVAPAQRSAPTGKPRKVKLTPSALKLAKKLGLTPEQYANQVLKDRGLL